MSEPERWTIRIHRKTFRQGRLSSVSLSVRGPTTSANASMQLRGPATCDLLAAFALLSNWSVVDLTASSAVGTNPDGWRATVSSTTKASQLPLVRVLLGNDCDSTGGHGQ